MTTLRPKRHVGVAAAAALAAADTFAKKELPLAEPLTWGASAARPLPKMVTALPPSTEPSRGYDETSVGGA